ncbi:hypothetical protein [Micromonospora sp. b486]|uniref:hypothetical protein n=1 Tax=unclassified Micromonospora TaxID=2617518 RepID=UPI00338E224D
MFAFIGAAGAAVGQVAGGLLTDALGWHWIFLINLPIGLATIERYGATSAHTLGLGALVAGFVVRQATARRPLMPLRLLRSRGVAVADVVQILTVAATFAFQVRTPVSPPGCSTPPSNSAWRSASRCCPRWPPPAPRTGSRSATTGPRP